MVIVSFTLKTLTIIIFQELFMSLKKKSKNTVVSVQSLFTEALEF